MPRLASAIRSISGCRRRASLTRGRDCSNRSTNTAVSSRPCSPSGSRTAWRSPRLRHSLVVTCDVISCARLGHGLGRTLGCLRARAAGHRYVALVTAATRRTDDGARRRSGGRANTDHGARQHRFRSGARNHRTHARAGGKCPGGLFRRRTRDRQLRAVRGSSTAGCATRLLPSLPARTTTVFVGRNPPNAAWRTAAGWRQLLVDMLVDPLTEADAAELVARQGLTGDRAECVLRFGRGHPLALQLACEALVRHPDLVVGDACRCWRSSRSWSRCSSTISIRTSVQSSKRHRCSDGSRCRHSPPCWSATIRRRSGPGSHSEICRSRRFDPTAVELQAVVQEVTVTGAGPAEKVEENRLPEGPG